MATVAPAGRGHAPFLETLIINKLQTQRGNAAKKVYVSTPYLKRYLIINQLHSTPRGRVPPLISPFILPRRAIGHYSLINSH